MAKVPEKKTAKGTAVPVVAPSAAPAPLWEHDIDRWFDEFRHLWHWPRLWSPERWPSRELMRMRMPAVDVYDEKDAVVVKADLPGMTKDDIEVSLRGSMLVITGEKKKEAEIKDEDYHRWERSYGAFTRAIDLPAEVKVDAVTATFQDGVLEVRLPKTEAAKRKAITVNVE